MMTDAKPSTMTNTGKWMALIAAILGWMFDGFEMGLFPVAGPPALTALLTPKEGDPTWTLAPAKTTKDDGSTLTAAEQTEARKKEVVAAAAATGGKWFGVIMAVFLIGAATGGVVFGWLGDKIGRVKAMSLSIFTYAIFSGLCGFATEAWHIAVMRFIASLGMGGEWSLGVALVTELWSDKSRAFIAGLIGAAANVGFLLVGVISITIRETLESGAAYPWRAVMISGAFPAFLIFFIRLFVPESEKWQHEKDKGGTSHWATRDLLGVLIGCLGAGAVVYVWSPAIDNPAVQWPVTAVGVVIALLGYLYPVVSYLRRSEAAGVAAAKVRDEAGQPALLKSEWSLEGTLGRLLLGAGLTGVALLGTWGTVQWIPRWTGKLTEGTSVIYGKEYAGMSSAVGAIIGTIIAAIVADKLGRRITYVLLCLASLGSCLLLFRGDMTYGPTFLWLVCLAGATTASFYGFFPFYLPELFKTRIRATSQGFAFNFGRVLASIGTLQAANLERQLGGFAAAGSALAFIYLIGVVIIWFGPETKGKPLPD